MDNLLVLCGGRWVGLVVQLRDAMRLVPSMQSGRIFLADMASLTPAGCFADDAFVVPAISDPEYVDCLIDICRSNDVRVVLPHIDMDLERLAPHADQFAAIGTTLVCPPPEIVELCLDKVQFDEFARQANLPVPRLFQLCEVDELDVSAFPLFAKRQRGFGGIGSGQCASVLEVRTMAETHPDLIFQEYVAADEVTVDAFIRSDGTCTVRVPRLRDKVLGGEAVVSHTIESDEVADLADRTIEALSREGLRGPLNLQIFVTAPPRLIEVNTRLGSASVLANMATRGRLYASVLRQACGYVVDGDPGDYERDLMLYRFFGDAFFSAAGSRSVVPGEAVWP